MRPNCFPLMLTALCLTSQIARGEVLLLDIDRAGPVAVDALKAAPEIRAWAEIGETLAVEATAQFAKRNDLQSRVLMKLTVSSLDQLATRALVHCNDGADAHDKHAAPADVLFERSHWQVLPALAKAKGGEPLHAGRVVAYQQGNRAAKLLVNDPAIDGVVAAIDIGHWRSKVNTLAGFNRLTAAGYGAAANVVEGEFLALGLESSRQQFTPPAGGTGAGRSFNVIGRQPGGGQGTLIIGAHLDSRNRTWDESLPSPGAEDNASGCAGVIEMARLLRGREFAADIVYVCYGLEERGLHGGVAHAAAQTPSQILGVINMDMIAYDGDGRLDLSLQATAPGFGLQQRLADNAARYTQLEVEIAQQTCCSDHQPYLDRGIAAVLLIENDYRIYPQYHTVDDTADRISDTMALATLKVAASTAAEVAKLQGGERYSGYWFDPAQSGHGFQIEVQDNNAVYLTWYTFDAAGHPLWVIATGSLVGNHAVLSANTVSGGAFPPAFNAANIAVAPWGSFELEFPDCGHAVIRWTPLPATGLPTGSLNAIRSSDPRGGGCN